MAREPEAVQAFLLQTSILNRLTGPLCDAVTGSTGSQVMLEQLERRNLFLVPLDGERRWYRYHHLFADLLQARLHQSGAERTAQLLSRAAEWCERDEQVAEAVGYAFAAQNNELAVRLIEKHWQQMSNNGEIETVFSWLNALPSDLLKNSPSLSTAFCMILWLRGQVGAIEAHLEDAESALALQNEAAQAAAGSAELRVILTVMRSFVARFHEHYETAIALAEHALERIPEILQPCDDEALRSLAFLALASGYDGAGDLEQAVGSYAATIRASRRTANASGIAGITFRMTGALRLLGRLRDADSACNDALQFLEAQGMSHLPAAGILHLAISEVLIERNNLTAAEAHLAQGIELGKWSGRMNAEKNAAYLLTRLGLARKDPANALAAIRAVETGLVEPVSPLSKADLLAYQARILVHQGAADHAARCIEAADRQAGQDQGQTRANVDLVACRVFAALYPTEDTIAHLSQTLAAAEACGRMGVVLELRLLRSLALARHGESGAAEQDLECALVQAAPEGYARIFLDEGQPMRKLLAGWLAHTQTHPVRDFAVRLLTQFDSETGSAPASMQTPSPAGDPLQREGFPTKRLLVEPLSGRELEVLQWMAEGCTNEAIARQLVVTRGTIKAHAASIYRKLDVANRTEAVTRARQLGLLH